MCFQIRLILKQGLLLTIVDFNGVELVPRRAVGDVIFAGVIYDKSRFEQG